MLSRHFDSSLIPQIDTTRQCAFVVSIVNLCRNMLPWALRVEDDAPARNITHTPLPEVLIVEGVRSVSSDTHAFARQLNRIRVDAVLLHDARQKFSLQRYVVGIASVPLVRAASFELRNPAQPLGSPYGSARLELLCGPKATDIKLDPEAQYFDPQQWGLTRAFSNPGRA
jgi:hypothetical protein